MRERLNGSTPRQGMPGHYIFRSRRHFPGVREDLQITAFVTGAEIATTSPAAVAVALVLVERENQTRLQASDGPLGELGARLDLLDELLEGSWVMLSASSEDAIDPEGGPRPDDEDGWALVHRDGYGDGREVDEHDLVYTSFLK